LLIDGLISPTPSLLSDAGTGAIIGQYEGYRERKGEARIDLAVLGAFRSIDFPTPFQILFKQRAFLFSFTL